MTQDEVIALAREAGIEVQVTALLTPFLERFAALVAAAEREACADLVQANADACESGSLLQQCLESNAAAIRARGKK